MLDDATFARFYRETAGALRQYAARMLGSSTQADDIVQEAFLRMLRYEPKVKADNELRAYVFRIASNLIKDGWRRQRHAPSSPTAIENSVHIDEALSLDMQRTFLRLRLLDRQLLWLAHVEGESHRDIAQSLGLREGSVRVLLTRARKKLGAMLSADTAANSESIADSNPVDRTNAHMITALADESTL